MNVAASVEIEAEPIAVDPRPCELCGLTIDRHDVVDDGDGPQHYCPEPDELTLDELERRAELVCQIEVAARVREIELADPRDCWKHTGEAPPTAAFRNGDSQVHQMLHLTPAPIRPRSSPPRSVVDAFWHLCRLGDPDHLARWLAEHPRDGEFLQKLFEAKHADA
jgi:hypothetical protein